MTPAFTRSALNKGIQMKEVSELFELAKKSTPGRNYDRLDSCGGGIKYQCIGNDGSLVLQCDHKNNEYGFIGPKAMEDEAFFLACKPETILAIAEVFQALQQKLTNVQEALKSAGIEADTVQAGVMELVSRMNQVAAENAALKHVFVTREFSTEVTDVFSDTAVLKIDGDEHYCHQWVDNDSDVIRAVLTAINAENPTPATDAYLNAVRAEGVERLLASLPPHYTARADIEHFAAQLLAGKDGV